MKAKSKTRPLLVMSLCAMAMMAVGMLVGCQSQTVSAPRTDGWQYVPQKPFNPTASRPIIMKDGDLIFGGKDGNGKDKIAWEQPPVAKAISTCSRLAAVVMAIEGKGTELRIYDVERKLLAVRQIS